MTALPLALGVTIALRHRQRSIEHDFPGPRSRRNVLFMLALPVLASCDPLFTTQFHQALAPAPVATCVEAALRASALAAVVRRDTADQPRGITGSYVVTVRDSMAPGGQWNAHLTQGGSGDSAWVRVSYSYMSYDTPRPTERDRLAGQARELLDQIRTRCSPATPRDVRCTSVGGFRGQPGACTPAA